MACQDNYIGLNLDDRSRSGLYASDLPGVEELFVELISKPSEDTLDAWQRVYRNAWTNMVSDIETYLQSKFWVNHKLLSRETSEIISEINGSTERAGVKISFTLPRYGRIHILSIKLYSDQDYPSPGGVIQIHDTDESGDLLYETDEPVTEGKNLYPVDQDFEVNNLFISYDPTALSLRKTENKFYNTGFPVWNKFDCMFPCFGGTGRVTQVNGGGLNVIYTVTCSAEKFVCENLNLFKKVLWWRIGLEMANERRIGPRLNEATTMTDERKTELFTFYNDNYRQALENSLKAQNIYEDPYCFQCKGVVNVKTNLP